MINSRESPNWFHYGTSNQKGIHHLLSDSLTWNFIDGSKRSQNSECPHNGEIVATFYYFLNQAGKKHRPGFI